MNISTWKASTNKAYLVTGITSRPFRTLFRQRRLYKECYQVQRLTMVEGEKNGRKD